ncbi:hypothetical protein CFC21_017301 [Triticum aestivum]|uniref:Uncharacterized protein n=2 Tax=Triticum aestivum TaxID=4565 RepID=A0A9R1E0U3_WHEAT|nr:hypothetical protein CFC21_017301 [Triticum aestivum]
MEAQAAILVGRPPPSRACNPALGREEFDPERLLPVLSALQPRFDFPRFSFPRTGSFSLAPEALLLPAFTHHLQADRAGPSSRRSASSSSLLRPIIAIALRSHPSCRPLWPLHITFDPRRPTPPARPRMPKRVLPIETFVLLRFGHAQSLGNIICAKFRLKMVNYSLCGFRQVPRRPSIAKYPFEYASPSKVHRCQVSHRNAKYP